MPDSAREIENLVYAYAGRIDGAWCFDTREMFVDLPGDLSHHLLCEL